VTRLDFKRYQIDHRMWIAAGTGWLTIKSGRYVAGPGLPHFKHQHPHVYAHMAANADKWMRQETGERQLDLI
jgi:hypothetical protein